MTSPTSSSDEQRTLRLSRQRLLRGYAPLLLLVLAIVMTTLLVPSVSREENVVTVKESVPAVAQAGGAGGTAASTGTSTPAASGALPRSGQGSAATSQSTGNSSASHGSAVTAGATTCPNKPLQVPGDPYSTPCFAFSGTNGGATSPGVTASTITLSYRIAADTSSTTQSLSSLGGASVATSVADTERTINGLVSYFNSRFQFYGRKLKVNYFNGQGSVTNELQGEGQAQATADATTVAQQIHAFADMTGSTQPYSDALAQQHVVNCCSSYESTQAMQSEAPYAWGPATSCNSLVQAVMGMVDGELANHPAGDAGGSLKGQPRKFAIISPQSGGDTSCSDEALGLAKQAGVTISDDLTYTLNLSTLTQQDDNIVAKLANDQITTVILLSDPISPLFLTERAAQQNYVPEWISTGVAGMDVDSIAQLYDQSEWSHAFGVSTNGAQAGSQANLGYFAYKSVNSDEPATTVVDTLYYTLDLLAIGIEMAGPDLTPATFQQGMRAYPGSQAGAKNAEFGTWAFPPGDFNASQGAFLEYWNPNQTSIVDGKPGAYVAMSPNYPFGQIPSGAPPLPADFPIAPAQSPSS